MLFQSDRGLQEAVPKKVGEPKEVACMAWYTRSGTLTPIMFKIEDDEGIIRSFNEIYVSYSEKKEYAGIASYEFKCEVNVHNFKINVVLEYYPETLKWYLYQIG